MGVIKKMTTIQRQAAIVITGALRTVPTELLDLHASLLPMHLEAERHQQRAAVRICTLLPPHPLADHLHRARLQSFETQLAHRAPLHDLLREYKLEPGKVEKRKAVRYLASWDLGLEVRLWQTEEEAFKHFLSNFSHIQIYTDRSGYKNGVGASAVLYRYGQEMEVLRYRLGDDTEHEVYEGECVGLLLALHLLAEELNVQSISIWADNTAALQAVTNPKMGPAHYILDWFHNTLKSYKTAQPNTPIFLSWIPSHTGIPGNKRADEEAKKAAIGDVSPMEALPDEL
ncbi:hypothetical protein D9758_018604 [Tetrapyrgos nigripes]|uniref:RNase H type-1 domain-containing protein n=1 Tax=Tetrapyrgos nigripes TaxID=182062 RepID=A0A8H5BSN1_9AGAR|nr:hypothetical protein D9758_018604 [Tetrapyrgos nigripes]